MEGTLSEEINGGSKAHLTLGDTEIDAAGLRHLSINLLFFKEKPAMVGRMFYPLSGRLHTSKQEDYL